MSQTSGIMRRRRKLGDRRFPLETASSTVSARRSDDPLPIVSPAGADAVGSRIRRRYRERRPPTHHSSEAVGVGERRLGAASIVVAEAEFQRLEIAAIEDVIRYPADYFGLAILGHQWKPARLLMMSHSFESAAHLSPMIASSSSIVPTCLLTMGSSTSAHKVSAGCNSGV